MAAARLNIPTIMVPCGYQASGEYKGKHVDIEEVFVGAMHAVTGNMPVEELVGMSREAIRSPGVCSGMGTANSMHIVCEALGMALPGSAPVAANSAKMMADVRAAGARIVQMVWDDLKPRDILTPRRFRQRGALRAGDRRLAQHASSTCRPWPPKGSAAWTSTACSNSWARRRRCSPACGRSANTASRHSRPPAAAGR